MTGIFGPSGSGKSSLLETIAGLRRGASGTVRLGDRLWLDSAAGRCLPPEERDVGFVPQDSLLFPHLDVRRNLLAGAGRARRGGGSPEDTARPGLRAAGAGSRCSTATSRRSRAASGVAWLSAERFAPVRGCCSWTSHWRRSTCRCGGGCCRYCAGCAPS